MRVAIDLVPIVAGHGGSGSGIWTYAENLLAQLDACCPPDIEIEVFIRRANALPVIPNKRLKFVFIPWPRKGIFGRLFWMHVVLPLLCWWRRVIVLHTLATDGPLWCPARRVTTVHDFYYEFLWEHMPVVSRRWYEWLEAAYFGIVTRNSFRKSTALITDSQAVRDEAAQRYPAVAAKLVVVPLGVVTTLLPDAQSETPWRILYPAKFMAYKGQLSAIAAVESLLVQRTELRARVQLIFRGYSNDRRYLAEFRARMAQSSAAANLSIADYARTATTAEIYHGFQAVLLLSRYEGFGLPVIEAQSQGLPVICSDLPVLREVAGDGAIFVPPDKPDIVAEVIERLMTEPDYYRAVAARGKANVARFKWAYAAQQTLAVYQQVGRDTDR
ncbi:MAG: glycosyltransferase family 1 protein [Verrucomicrobia bacterium]|nr:MAG: glycosyltransferase family 1 protein [Verrucomicrobiota bacterium]